MMPSRHISGKTRLARTIAAAAPAPSADVNLTGTGAFYGGDNLNGRITGHREGAYAVIINSVAGSPVCTGLIRHAPGTVRTEAVNLHCTDGASGTGVLATNRSGQGFTFPFTFRGGGGGYVTFN